MSASPCRNRSHSELEAKVKTLEVRQTGMKSTIGRRSTENAKVSELEEYQAVVFDTVSFLELN